MNENHARVCPSPEWAATGELIDSLNSVSDEPAGGAQNRSW